MNADDEKFLRLAKEILVKFIELGRVSPNNFDEHFRSVFWTLKNTVASAQLRDFDFTQTTPPPDSPDETPED